MNDAMPAARRFTVAIGLGVLFGLLCILLAAQQQPALASPSHPVFWAILTDRILIGLVVALAGAYTTHPILGFAYRPWARGSCLGAVTSLPLAAGAMSGAAPTAISSWVVFFATLSAGAVYGAIIDAAATRSGGEGVSLLTPR